MALSITFSTMRESSVSLPVTHASGRCCCSTSSPSAEIASARRSIASAGELGERDRRLVGERPLLALGEGEEALQQPVDVVELAAEPVGERADVRGQRAGFGHRHVERGPHSGERRAQLVRGVGDELALERERALEPVEQLVEGVCELLQLVVGAGEVQTLVQVGGGDLPGGRRDRAQRPQEPPGHQPTDRERGRGHDRQGDRGGDQRADAGRSCAG